LNDVSLEANLKSQRTKLRLRAGFTLQTLAAASGVSVSRLSNWENGHVEVHPEELARIADLIKAELDALPVLRHTSQVFHFLREGAH
jgi:transcriptional regulator with XRE-family HTH domain